MTCAKCGYMLGAFDKECARCKKDMGDKNVVTSLESIAPLQIALVSCPACQQQVSSQAVSCPKCGQPIAHQVGPHLQTYATALVGNGSGTGATAVLPAELAGFSWGAFWLSWVWAIANNTWIGLLSLIPYVGIIMWFILGSKGNEWAWQNRKWESAEEFKRVQGVWAKSGLVTFLVVSGIAIVVSIFQFMTINAMYKH